MCVLGCVVRSVRQICQKSCQKRWRKRFERLLRSPWALRYCTQTTCGDNWPNFIHCVCMYIFCSNVKHRISDTIITLHYYCVATRHPCPLFKLQSELHECIFISTPWHRKRRCIGSESPAYSTVLYIVKMV